MTNPIHQHPVSADDDGQRLERLLKRLLPHVPHGVVQKLLRTKAIRLNGEKAAGDARVAMGDVITWPEGMNAPQDRPDLPKPSKSDLEVLHDDEDLLVINKQKGVATQGGSGQTVSIDYMLGAYTSRAGVKPRLVHRLDKDTSGVLLTARTAEMARRLTAQFKRRDMEKVYLAVVHPAPRANKGVIDARVKKSVKGGQEKMVVADDGDNARTRFEVLDRRKHHGLVMFWPETGRMHQIRIHASHAGMPLLGDVKYGGTPNDYGLHLHALQITFPHPVTGYNLMFYAAPPAGFIETLQGLGLSLPDGI